MDVVDGEGHYSLAKMLRSHWGDRARCCTGMMLHGSVGSRNRT